MQAVDNRESRLRKAFVKIERGDGRVRGEDLIRLLTVTPGVRGALRSDLQMFQTKGSMRLSTEEAEELLARTTPDCDGLYSRDDLIHILTC